MTEKTIFEKIRDREVPADIVYEDETVIAFKDINPQAPVHILVVPRHPYPTLEDVPEGDPLHAHLLAVARKVARLQGIEKNYRLAMNVGRQVQEVHHVHLHVLGGWRRPQLAAKVAVVDPE